MRCGVVGDDVVLDGGSALASNSGCENGARKSGMVILDGMGWDVIYLEEIVL